MLAIRRTRSSDAEAILVILRQIVEECIHSAIDEPFTIDQQRAYLEGLSPREAVHVAADESGRIAGYQTLDLWAPTIRSMGHAAQIGTFLRPDCRGQGTGTALFGHTSNFARAARIEKLIAQVRASNVRAQAFYTKLGFRPCGRFMRQVKINGIYDDEILMEMFL